MDHQTRNRYEWHNTAEIGQRGYFIIIAGDSSQETLNNAVLTSYQLSQIFIDATGYQNFNSCTYIQLGPVAILPYGHLKKVTENH